MAQEINIVISAQDKASKPIRRVSDEIDGGTQKSSKFRSALGALGTALKATTLAAGATAIALGTAGATIGFGFNSSVEQATTKLDAFMRDGDRVAQTLSWVKQEAAATQFSFTDMADAAANLTPVANSSGVALKELVRQAEILAAVNPAEGLTGATFSLREALSGDWVSIIDRFNLPRQRINQLKEEGVPAMEIISRTLKEMGIDYSLVEKQGQTVSARFDQVRDKLTMMAGAASKPIFDRVSQELGNLDSFDFEALGERLAGIVSGGIDAIDDFIPKVQELGKQVGDYLGPKFATVWQITQEKLFPALQNLWKQVLEPLIPVVGELLVGALGLAVDMFGKMLEVVSPLISFLADNTWVIWGVVGAIGAFKVALQIQEGVAAFQSSVEAMKGAGGLQGLTDKFMATRGTLLTQIVMPAIAVGAAIAAIAAVKQAYDEMKAAVEGAKRAVDSTMQSTRDLMARNAEVQASGVYSPSFKARWQTATERALQLDGALVNANQKTSTVKLNPNANMMYLPKFASGTNSAPGGWSLMHEHGPELVNLPRGAQVTPAYQARAGAGAERSGPLVVIESYNSYGERDDNRFFRDLGFRLELAS